MTFELSSLVQKPNLWYSTTCVYEGEGQAEFENPRGKVWGHTIASFQENGQFQIVMTVEGLEAEQQLPLGLHQLLSADEPYQDGNELKLIYPPHHANTCIRIIIKTASGTFNGESIVDVAWSFSANPNNITERLTFSPRKMWFDVDSSSPALYWNAPLINFITDFVYDDESLGRHPLRIFPDSILPEDVPEEKMVAARLTARSKSKLIVFDHKGGKGFIERLPDYSERVEQLTSRHTPHAITAIMVVPLNGEPYEPVDVVDDWFPHYLIDLLEIATGTEVEAPWIEFHDSNGNLVRRVHKLTQSPLFLPGIKVLDELHVRKGIGKLLEISQHSPHVCETFFRVALRHTVLAGREEQILEDRLDHLCRALETLCEHYGFRTQKLLVHTSKLDQKTIKQELAIATIIVDKIRKEAIKRGDYEQVRLLATIQGRIDNVANQEKKFGLAVSDLLSMFGLFDSDVIDNFYSHEPRKDKLKTWADVISQYRGSVFHFGFFKLQNGEMDIEDIVTIVRHLHDILVRIIFLLTGYTGDYLAKTIEGNPTRPVQWVQKNTPIELLGYKKKQQGPLMIVSDVKE